jgi:hypothetical protein
MQKSRRPRQPQTLGARRAWLAGPQWTVDSAFPHLPPHLSPHHLYQWLAHNVAAWWCALHGQRVRRNRLGPGWSVVKIYFYHI